MKREDLLRNISETAYNVGYGAKKHFATFDIIAKLPGIIAFSSTAVGVFSLLVEYPSKKFLSAAFIVFGMAGLRIGMWDHKKTEYAEAGEALTAVFNKLKALHFQVKAAKDEDLPKFEEALADLQGEYSRLGRSNQILFSDWYAHYKFFWQQQIQWIEEYRKFGFWRDKVPLSLSAAVLFIIVVSIVSIVIKLR